MKSTKCTSNVILHAIFNHFVMNVMPGICSIGSDGEAKRASQKKSPSKLSRSCGSFIRKTTQRIECASLLKLSLMIRWRQSKVGYKTPSKTFQIRSYREDKTSQNYNPSTVLHINYYHSKVTTIRWSCKILTIVKTYWTFALTSKLTKQTKKVSNTSPHF